MADTDRIAITTFGRGRNTRQNSSQLRSGEARDSLNLRHSHPLEAVSRKPVDRIWATRPNGAVATLAAWQFKTGAGTEYRLAKIGSKLYSFSLTPGTAATELKTGLDSTHLPGVACMNGLSFIADWQATNYVTDGTVSGTNELQKTSPTGVFTLASAGTATGNVAATITYWYSDVDAFSGAESPPSAAVTVSRSLNAGVTVTNSSLTFTTPWTTKKLYRTISGDEQPYLVASGLTSGSFPYADTSLDDNLVTTSTIHDDVGAASIEKPAAAKHACAHRGRLFLANFAASGSNTPTRVRWSKPIEPTQFSNATTAQWDGSKNDGAGEVTGIVSFRGALVIFKRHSIWVMNGDQDEQNFTFFPAVTGVGCIAPRTIRKDGDVRILFLAASGVYSFDLSKAEKLSDIVQPDFDTLNLVNRSDFMCAGVDFGNRLYHVSVSPSGVSTNTKTYTLNLDSDAWGRQELGMGVVVPSCYSDTSDEGPIKNSTGQVKIYVGDESGYLYETESTSAVGDGVTSGTVAATVTSRTSGTTTCGAASFRTTGDGLTGLPMTVRRAADSTYETVTITSNTGTVVSHGALSGTAIVAGDTIYIGAYQTTLSLGRVGGVATTARKRWVRICAEFEKESVFSYYLRLGYTLDGDTAPTAKTEIDMSGGYRASFPVQRRAVGLSPYLDMIGPSLSWQIVLLELFVVPLERRLPTRT